MTTSELVHDLVLSQAHALHLVDAFIEALIEQGALDHFFKLA